MSEEEALGIESMVVERMRNLRYQVEMTGETGSWRMSRGRSAFNRGAFSSATRWASSCLLRSDAESDRLLAHALA